MKQKILKHVCNKHSLDRSDIGLEKFFGDWIWVGKAACFMESKNSQLNKLDIDIEVWCENFTSKVPTNIKQLIDNVDWNGKTIFNIH